MIRLNVLDLTGSALDWAVAKAINAERIEINEEYKDIYVDTGPEIYTNWMPSTDWAQGGPLIEQYNIAIFKESVTDLDWHATKDGPIYYIEISSKGGSFGPTPLIAAMRAIITINLGDVVEVPKELI